ncbi:MAG TPA: type I DNA topoisomerase, partial [Acidimicrobiales bacterium]|nr:type I DNA topoisomerase [Acidimicrobiales bacterium]
GDDYLVESSVGHIRDLPKNATEIPAAYKSEKWSRDGVDVDNDFKPLYVVPDSKRAVVKELKAKLKDASEVYLATDEDREGESISWHLLEVLSPRVPVKRMVFHEITRAAIEEAVANPRDLDLALVDAQETRRILDRLYGYRLSEVLWRKGSGKSAGRVQSVAVRVLVERERARMAFRAAGYWGIDATFAKDATSFGAALVSVNEARVATGKDFDAATGALVADRLLLDEAGASGLVDRLGGVPVTVRSVEEKAWRSSPKAPFITSTLQQEAGRKLGMTASRAMRAAQSLYENGFITYMRTDSTNLSAQAISAARAAATDLYGREYVPDAPRTYAKKVKNAQEAHEAIRPAGDTFRHPDQVSGLVGGDEARVYDLIWKRTVASQMADAVGRTVSARLVATTAESEVCEFTASGKVVTFPGYQRAYVEGSDDPDAELENRDKILPPLADGDAVDAEGYRPESHITKPPARFTEASLIARLEELGVGRPSTYASIIGTLLDPARNYAAKRGSALVPTWTAFAVVQLLETHFPQFVDYGFTASMEDDLDRIAAGDAERVPWLANFYFGDGRPGLKPLIDQGLDTIDAAAINAIRIGEDDTGAAIVVRVGKYGPFLQRGEERGPLPPDIAPDELTVAKAVELIEAPSGDRTIGEDPETGLTVFAKTGRYGPYVQLGELDQSDKKAPKPKMASLFKTMTVEDVTLDEALQLLTQPRVVGIDPSDGQEITAQNGKYGPYLKKGVDSRNLPDEESIFAITLEETVAIYAQPKQWGKRAAKPPLAEYGADPVSGRPIVAKEGKFGAYVTDGETNATIPRGVDVELLSAEQAIELLAERRAKGPSVKKKAAPRRAPAKKKAAAKKKPAAKKKA